ARVGHGPRPPCAGWDGVGKPGGKFSESTDGWLEPFHLGRIWLGRFGVPRDEEGSTPARLHGGAELRCRRRAEGELSAQRMVACDRQKTVGRLDVNPRTPRFRRADKLPRVDDEIRPAKRLRKGFLF